jgi:hypothetical protein
VSARSAAVVESEFDGGESARAFMTNLRSDISTIGDRPVLLDRALPEPFAPAWMFPYNLLRFAADTLRLPATTGGHGSNDPVYYVTDDGRAQPFTFRPIPADRSGVLGVMVGSPLPGPGTCVSVPPGGAVLRLPLAGPDVLAEPRVLRVEYQVDAPVVVDVFGAVEDGAVELSLGEVPMDPGDTVHDFALRAVPGASAIDLIIEGQADAVPVCVDATIGAAQPAG